MTHRTIKQAKLTTIASFPPHYFLENLAIRRDNSILVTVLNHKELWYVPPSVAEPVEPQLLYSFAQPALGITEADPDIFYICTSNVYSSHESFLHRLDMRGWAPGMLVSPEIVFEFPALVRALNGCCLLSPNVLLVADSIAALIWRVDLPSDDGKISARVWLKHDSMAFDPSGPLPDQPGVNGVRFAPKTNHLYYTSTARRLFMRVLVDPVTHNPIGDPEFVMGGMMYDDFCIDDNTGLAYVTTHRQNTIERLALEPSENTDVQRCVAGDPLTEQLIGPSSGAWGRGASEYGRVAYFLTDGGTKSLKADQTARPARVLRVEF